MTRRVRLVIVGAAALGAAGLAFVVAQIATWPDVAALATTNPSTTAFIERWKGAETKAGRRGVPDWRPVPASRISKEAKLAVVVSEDIEFFSHDGFSREEIRNAIEEAWEEGRAPRGASTITQQLAKNLWLTPSRNPWRKAKEVLLTRALEAHLDKRRILELYLNVAEFGPGIYGVEAASRRYFGMPAADLDRAAAASLAAALPNPARWNPRSATPYARRRAASIERTMEQARGWLSRQF